MMSGAFLKQNKIQMIERVGIQISGFPFKRLRTIQKKYGCLVMVFASETSIA
jgi:hypothetical protein